MRSDRGRRCETQFLAWITEKNGHRTIPEPEPEVGAKHEPTAADGVKPNFWPGLQ